MEQYDSNGGLLWSRTTCGDMSLNSGWYGIAADCGGRTVVAGIAARSGEDSNWRIVGYTREGNIWWDEEYDSAQNWDDVPTAVAFGKEGAIVVAGYYGESISTQADWLIRKYLDTGSPCYSSPPPGTGTPPDPGHDLGAGSVRIIGGIRGYINPKRGEKATIQVRLKEPGKIRVRIYDLMGRLLTEFSKDGTSGRTTVLHWDGTTGEGSIVPTGTYPITVEGPGVRFRDTLAVLR